MPHPDTKQRRGPRQRPWNSRLSRRQLQVAEGYARGLSQQEIAGELGITLKTLKRHVTSASRKLDLPGSPRHKLTVFILGGQQ